MNDWGIYDLGGEGDLWYLARSPEEAVETAKNDMGPGWWDGAEDAEKLTEDDLDRLSFLDEDGTKLHSFRDQLQERIANDPTPSLFASSDY